MVLAAMRAPKGRGDLGRTVPHRVSAGALGKLRHEQGEWRREGTSRDERHRRAGGRDTALKFQRIAR